jgi:hypothetical protein
MVKNSKKKKLKTSQHKKTYVPSKLFSSVHAKIGAAILALGLGVGVPCVMNDSSETNLPLQSGRVIDVDSGDWLYLVTPDIAQKTAEIEKEGERIIKKLGIDTSNVKTEKQQLETTFDLFKYVVENSVSDKGARMQVPINKKDLEYVPIANYFAEIESIHEYLFEGKSMCRGDSATLSYLLRKAKINSSNIVMFDKNDLGKEGHAIATVQIGGTDEMILDVTMFRKFLSDGVIPDMETMKKGFMISNEYYFRTVLPEIFPDVEFNVAVRNLPIEPVIKRISTLSDSKQISDIQTSH